MFKQSNVEIIQAARAGSNTIHSCRFATVWTGTLNFSGKIFEKESLERVLDTPQRIILSNLECNQNLNESSLEAPSSTEAICDS